MDKFEVIASNKKFFTMTEILTKEEEEEEEKETELDSIYDLITDTVKLADEKIFSFFQGELDSLNIPEGAKVALKTLSKFVSVLTNKTLGKTEKAKNLLKLSTKVAFKTWQEQN